MIYAYDMHKHIIRKKSEFYSEIMVEKNSISL